MLVNINLPNIHDVVVVTISIYTDIQMSHLSQTIQRKGNECGLENQSRVILHLPLLPIHKCNEIMTLRKITPRGILPFDYKNKNR